MSRCICPSCLLYISLSLPYACANTYQVYIYLDRFLYLWSSLHLIIYSHTSSPRSVSKGMRGQWPNGQGNEHKSTPPQPPPPLPSPSPTTPSPHLVSVVVAHVPQRQTPVVLGGDPLDHLSSGHPPPEYALDALADVVRPILSPRHLALSNGGSVFESSDV